ncbi:MAG TPA: pentapeptide repeat-containing protein [Rhizomicrobium sp.]|nr:pentapeptide repeat-containing protein [Rhizomicrobium sp.]
MLKNIHSEPRTPITQAELNAAMASHEKYVAAQGGLRAQFTLKLLDGLNLANRNLSDADFSGASLVSATLFGSNLMRANFYCADLRGCNLRCANLARADLRGASFKGANLSNAMLDNADMRAATMMFVRPGGVSVLDRNKATYDDNQAVGVDFSNCSMKNVSLGNAKLSGANFSGAILHGANFKGAQLPNVMLDGAILTGVSLKDLAVPQTALKGCVTDASQECISRANSLKAEIEAHERWIGGGGKVGKPTTLDGEDIRPLQGFFAGRPLSALSLRNAMAIGADFSGCQLQGARFDGADLRDANFTGADLRGASFAGANLHHARFDRADMTPLALANGTSLAPNLLSAQAAPEQFFSAIMDGDASSLGLGAESSAIAQR